MTGVPGTVGRSEWQWPRAPGAPRRSRRQRPGRLPARASAGTLPRLALRALAFFALALLASAHWAALVEPAHPRRMVVVSLIVTVGGVAIAASRWLPWVPRVLLRIVLVPAMLLFAIAAIGIRFKLLMPAGWSALSDRISGGLSIVGHVTSWPYDGPNTWLRLTIVLAAPLVLVLASALTFWPARREWPRAAALVLLVAMYAVAVAARPFSAQALRGLALLACLAAWVWLPRLRGRDAAAAAITVGIAALAALVLTPRLASSDPWVDYHDWSLDLHKQKTFAYDWRQSYGPLHWPRKNKTLLLIKANQAQYWKAETLDEFDGFRWTTPPIGQRAPTVVDREVSQNTKWIRTVTITDRALASQLIIAPGSILQLHGIDSGTVYLSNGAYMLDGQLQPGDSYTVQAYVPHPTVKQMRAAPLPDEFFARYTEVGLPDSRGYVEAVSRIGLRGEPRSGDPNALPALEGSRYARVYALAKKIAAGATTNYDIVRRIGTYLQSHYTYSEHVPKHKYALSAFLFTDKRGYCQQFSGAAALMLRMLGVPVRVASGFAPGTKNAKTGEYVVRDLDAHSWIEVWFAGIGWVPFDPTPALAPAASQAPSFPLSEVAAGGGRGASRDRLTASRLDKLLHETPQSPGGAGAAGASQHHFPWGWVVLAAAVVALIAAALVVSLVRLRPGRVPPPPASGDVNVDHMVRMLTRLGLDVPPGTTLLELEQRVERLGGAEAALYARQLRRLRYADAHDLAPDRWDRRKLRLMLARGAGAGPVTRLRLAMPVALRPLRGGRAQS